MKIDVNDYLEELVTVRRWIHQHAEGSFHENQTAEYVYNYLASLNIDPMRVGETGVVATIDTGRSGKTIAFRAELDALSLQEESGVEFTSLNKNFMHACGHDSHMAISLIAAKYIKEHLDQFRGKVKFIFQPAEELPPGGAIDLVKAGVVDDVDEIYALHCDPSQRTGTILVVEHVLMAAVDRFQIDILGRAGHAAAPQRTADAIVMACDVVMNLQTIVSRSISPTEAAVVSIGSIKGGDSFNAIAGQVSMKGTVRTLTPQSRTFIEERIKKTVHNIVEIYGGTCKIDYLHGYPPVVNNFDAIRKVEQVVSDVLGPDKCIIRPYPDMGGDDFAYYLEKVKGAMFYYGTNPTGGDVFPLHSPHFVLDESAMINGVKMLIGLCQTQE